MTYEVNVERRGRPAYLGEPEVPQPRRQVNITVERV